MTVLVGLLATAPLGAQRPSVDAAAPRVEVPAIITRGLEAYRAGGLGAALDIWLAGNVSTPPDVLLEISRTSESIDAVRVLLGHPALACETIESAKHGPALRLHPGDADIEALLASGRASRCR
jgi:hypothetical protein